MKYSNTKKHISEINDTLNLKKSYYMNTAKASMMKTVIKYDYAKNIITINFH